jgi:hypothetical protein
MLIVYKDTFRDAIHGLAEENIDICIVENSQILTNYIGIQLNNNGINYSFDILTNIKYRDVHKNKLPVSLTSNMIFNGRFNINGDCDNIGILSLYDISSADVGFLRPRFKKYLKSQPINYNIQYMDLNSILEWIDFNLQMDNVVPIR